MTILFSVVLLRHYIQLAIAARKLMYQIATAAGLPVDFNYASSVFLLGRDNVNIAA